MSKRVQISAARPVLIPTTVSRTIPQIAARSRCPVAVVAATIQSAVAAGTVRAVPRSHAGLQWTEFQAVKS